MKDWLWLRLYVDCKRFVKRFDTSSVAALCRRADIGPSHNSLLWRALGQERADRRERWHIKPRPVGQRWPESGGTNTRQVPDLLPYVDFEQMPRKYIYVGEKKKKTPGKCNTHCPPLLSLRQYLHFQHLLPTWCKWTHDGEKKGFDCSCYSQLSLFFSATTVVHSTGGMKN